VYKGETITANVANVSIRFGQNYTFNTSTSELYGVDTATRSVIPLASGQNLTISSDTPEQVNTTLWGYNLSDDLSFGKTLIKLEVSAVADSTVDVAFTGVPSPGDRKFAVAADGNHVKDVTSGGSLSWTHDDWSATNFTVTYQKSKMMAVEAAVHPGACSPRTLGSVPPTTPVIATPGLAQTVTGTPSQIRPFQVWTRSTWN
jgi:hypothetical protein